MRVNDVPPLRDEPNDRVDAVGSDQTRPRPLRRRRGRYSVPVAGAGPRMSGRSPRGRLRPGARVLAVSMLIVAGSLLFESSAAAQAQSVDAVLTNVRDWLMGILAGLATVFLSVGGVRYVMAAGDPGEVEKAKGSFKSAGWGYGLAALAPLVVEILRGIVGV